MQLFCICRTPVVYCEPKITKPIYHHITGKNRNYKIKLRRLYHQTSADNEEAKNKVALIEEQAEKKLWETFYQFHPAVLFLGGLPKEYAKFIKSCIHDMDFTENEYCWKFHLLQVPYILIINLLDTLRILCPPMYFIVTYDPYPNHRNTYVKIFFHREDFDEIAFNKYIFSKNP